MGKSAILIVENSPEDEDRQRQQEEIGMHDDKGGMEVEDEQRQENRIDTAKAVSNRSSSANREKRNALPEVHCRHNDKSEREAENKPGRKDRTDTAKAVSNRSNQGEKKKGKPKYVPGPIGALIDQAAVVGLHLTVNAKDELEFQRKGRGSIPLTGWNKKAWKKK